MTFGKKNELGNSKNLINLIVHGFITIFWFIIFTGVGGSGDKCVFGGYEGALAFKNGKNLVTEDKRTVSYLYNDNVLIETPEFFEWNESIEKKFEKDKK